MGVIAGVNRAGEENSESSHPARTRRGAINAASGTVPIQASHLRRVIPDPFMCVLRVTIRGIHGADHPVDAGSSCYFIMPFSLSIIVPSFFIMPVSNIAWPISTLNFWHQITTLL